ncbi:2'-5' RNA ligase [Persicimonas caeni]|uniref:2'-5' RNA ligase n=1 Tax=Persicimonas caeni TaxID=2292766 RepID=A0A4Y6Q026_PERCE|nr:RNA ligase family protein [Persicimonas caeni]QDG53926.1 2'-5' RNA ligase [Persicimonas caeni]QED35147.1 2'-5' RNA ligase [Persicimonas caeni]
MTNYTKYPRTPHLPWSPGASEDDVFRWDVSNFEGREVVVTEKRDGENTTMYRDHIHARSVDSRHHPSRNWVKRLQGRIGHLIPEAWRVCGENLYAEHSLRYTELASYFEVFSVWNEENVCLDWDAALEWCALLGLEHVPILYRGPWHEELIRGLADDIDTETQEGYVVRTAEGFHHGVFRDHIAKWVRSNHVTTDEHWMHREVIANGLAED